MLLRATIVALFCPLIVLVQESLVQATPQTILIRDVSSSAVPKERRKAVIDSLTQGLEGKKGWQVIAPPAGNDGSAIVAKIDGILAEAKRLSQQFKEKEALALLLKGDALFKAEFGPLVSVEPLRKLLIARAKLETDLNQPKKALATLLNISALDPEFKVDPGTFVPRLIKRYNRATKKRKRRRGAILVESDPESLPAWVDGKPYGNTPTSVVVVSGTHYVAVGHPSATVGQVTTVKDRKTALISLKVPTPNPTDDNSLREEGKANDANWIVTVNLTPRGVGWQISLRALRSNTIDVAWTKSSKTVTEEKQTWASAELAVALRDKIAPPKNERIAQNGRKKKTQKEEKSIVKKWWFWTIIGTAVVGGAVAATVVLTQPEPQVQLVISP